MLILVMGGGNTKCNEPMKFYYLWITVKSKKSNAIRFLIKFHHLNQGDLEIGFNYTCNQKSILQCS